MRRSVGVSRLMNMLKKDYWLTESSSRAVETGKIQVSEEHIAWDAGYITMTNEFMLQFSRL